MRTSTSCGVRGHGDRRDRPPPAAERDRRRAGSVCSKKMSRSATAGASAVDSAYVTVRRPRLAIVSSRRGDGGVTERELAGRDPRRGQDRVVDVERARRPGARPARGRRSRDRHGSALFWRIGPTVARPRTRVRLQVQRGGAGDVRRRHRGAAHRLVAALLQRPRRADQPARRGDVGLERQVGREARRTRTHESCPAVGLGHRPRCPRSGSPVPRRGARRSARRPPGR